MWWLISSALALQPTPVAPPGPTLLPGRALVLSPCEPAPDAACWATAAAADRFAAPPGVEAVPVLRRLRLAWSPQGLLVRGDDLAPGQRVELGYSNRAEDHQSVRLQSITVAAGTVALLPLDAPIRPGEIGSLRLNLLLADPRGGGTLSLP